MKPQISCIKPLKQYGKYRPIEITLLYVSRKIKKKSIKYIVRIENLSI